MSTKVSVYLVFSLVISSLADLSGFLREKMVDFPTYIQQRKLDPTPLDERVRVYTDSNAVFGLSTKLSDMVISGYSSRIRLDHWESDLISGRFDLSIRSEAPYTSTGTHVTNWTVAGTPVSSEGHWFLHFNSIYSPKCGIKFSVLPSGYLNVTDVYSCNLAWYLHNVTFEGISDNEAAAGYQDYVEPLLEETIRTYLEDVADNVITNIHDQFWAEIFSNTTLVELIGSTTETYEPTSTTPYWTGSPDPSEETSSYWTDWTYPSTGYTTYNPCIGFLKILEEKVLETKTVTEENGDVVLIMKTLVVKEEAL